MSDTLPNRRCTCRHGESSHFRRADGSRGSCMHRQDEQPTACPCRQFTEAPRRDERVSDG